MENTKSDKLTSLVIGDPHFKAKNILEGLDFVERLVNIAQERLPTFIVLLGDILDTHEVVRVAPHKLAVNLIDQLSKIAPTYILIGNHDLINHSQFLTDNHIFTPMKKWENVYVADTIPLVLEISDSDGNDRTFVFCPYTPPGRFSEALDTLVSQGDNWQFADCIFAHQEFEGCKMDQITSEIGDSWDEDYPPVISGHIHDFQILGSNIFYPGSAIQHSFGESSAKRVWFVNWEPEENNNSPNAYEEQGFSVEKIDLGMKPKRMVSLTVEELQSKENDEKFIKMAKNCYLKIKLKGNSDEFKQFRRSRFSSSLKKLDVKFAYSLVENEELDTNELFQATRKELSFQEVFKEVVSKRDKFVKDEYSTLFGITVGDTEEDSGDSSNESGDSNDSSNKSNDSSGEGPVLVFIDGSSE